ncbi:MAG: hypothetical protein ABIK68_17800 [bacterium]
MPESKEKRSPQTTPRGPQSKVRPTQKQSSNPRSDSRTNTEKSVPARGQTGIIIHDLKPINRIIPYKRSFLNISPTVGGATGQEQGFIRKVRGFFDGSAGKGLSKEEIVRLRKAVGDLKSISEDINDKDGQKAPQGGGSRSPKTKRELLEEKRKALDEKSRTEKKSSPSVGMRIELEKMKKSYPNDPNLTILSAIMTSKDSVSVHRSVNDRINSLYSALQATGAIVMNEYMTTYSVDVLCDIYFLYLEAIRPKLVANLKTVTASESHSIRRDIHVLNLLFEQKRLKKTITNITKKLDGFGYPYESMSPLHIAKTFQAANEEGDTRVGPGTVKLNKFLIRIYLTVFSQIPALMPIAKKMCDVLPSNRQSRALIANVNIENAIMNMRIAKLNKSMDLPKMITTVYNYGKGFVGINFSESVTSPVEAKILIKVAQMVEEMAMLSSNLDPEVITYAYSCATVALHYYKDEAEVLIRRLSDIAARQRIDLNRPTGPKG